MLWQWRMMQKLKGNWLIVLKLTWGTSKIKKIFVLIGSLWPKYILFELQKYRGVIFHDTEEICKFWRKTDLWFEKRLEKFGKFSPEHFLSNFGGWRHSFALSNWYWKNKKIYLKINIFIFTFSLTRYPLGYSEQCCHYAVTSPLIYRTNQWDGFYTMAKLDWNKLSFF